MSSKQNGVFSTIEKYYKDYGVRARELKKEGRKVIGYVCSFVPLEIITASGAIPFRVRGNIHEPITKGDTLLETIVCPYYRSCFDLSVKEKYEFLSGMVIPHGCDSKEKQQTRYRGSGRGGPGRPTYTTTKLRYVITEVRRYEVAIDRRKPVKAGGCK